MEPEQQIVFGPFRFDRTTQRLWQGQREIGLRARTMAVLHYLLEHPGRVIGCQEFSQQVWGWVEHIVSGQVTYFQTVEELAQFMVHVLTCPTEPSQGG